MTAWQAYILAGVVLMAWLAWVWDADEAPKGVGLVATCVAAVLIVFMWPAFIWYAIHKGRNRQ